MAVEYQRVEGDEHKATSPSICKDMTVYLNIERPKYEHPPRELKNQK